MSGIMQPKGGAPPSVYWRRRLVLLAIVLLVAAGGFKLFGGGDDGDDGDGGGESQATERSSSDGGDESSRNARGNGEKKQKVRRNRAKAKDDVAAGERNVAVKLRESGACDPAAVTVTASLASGAHAGDPVPLRLAFSTTAEKPCALSLSKHEPLVSVSDGSDLVWQSERCTELIDTERVRLEPGWLTYVDATWSGRASGQTCGERADFAEPGSYEIKAAVLGGEPTSATVELDEKPEPDKTKKNKAGKKKRDDEPDKKDKPDKKGEDDKKQDDTSARADEDSYT